MANIRDFFEPKAKRPPMPTRPPPKSKKELIEEQKQALVKASERFEDAIEVWQFKYKGTDYLLDEDTGKVYDVETYKKVGEIIDIWKHTWDDWEKDIYLPPSEWDEGEMPSVYNLEFNKIKKEKVEIKRIQTKPIGYEKLLDGMKTVAKQWKVMKNGVKVVADVNDLINMMKYTGSTDTAFEPPPDLNYHPLCNKHNFSSFSKKDKPNCLCSQEDLRYLFHFKVPVDKIKTNKYNDFIVGSNCVRNLLADENIPKEVRDLLKSTHQVMVDSEYYKCKRCGERNGHIGIHGNTKKGGRTDYCSVCSKILTKINNEIKKCKRKKEWGTVRTWRKLIRDFQDLETFIPFCVR